MQTFRIPFLADLSHAFCIPLKMVCGKSQIVNSQTEVICGNKPSQLHTLHTFGGMLAYTRPYARTRARARGRSGPKVCKVCKQKRNSHEAVTLRIADLPKGYAKRLQKVCERSATIRGDHG
jgi:hypothetical protein